MSSDKWNEQYLNHHDYTFFKSKYNIDGKLPREKSENLETIIKRLEDESNGTSKFKSLLELLMKYLNNGHVMYYCGGDTCCRYVNYEIAKKARDENYDEYVDKKFDIFKKFMKKYYDILKDKSCQDRLNYINPLILSRMRILYDLYDKYNELISLKRDDQRDQLCITLSLLVRDYKAAIDLHEGDEKFIKQLEQVRNQILSKKSKYNSECQRNLSETTLPKPVISRQEETHEVQEKKLSSHVPEEQSTHNELEKSSTIVSASSESKLSGQSRLQSQSIQSTEVQPPSANPHSVQTLVNSESTHSDPVQIKREQPEEEKLHVTQLPLTGDSRREWPTRGFMGLVDQNTYTSEYPNSGAEHTGGVLGKVQDFFSGTLGQVDPVPVVGVSGGMGALFLLFRYTPVGAFFRGGRRRAHTIPRSFNGQFLGGFPGYEDYEVGHIGYGPMSMNPLAE